MRRYRRRVQQRAYSRAAKFRRPDFREVIDRQQNAHALLLLLEDLGPDHALAFEEDRRD